MGRFIEVRYHGVAEITAALERLGEALSRQVLEAALKKAAVPISDEAERLCPRSDDPGLKHLADSISIRTRRSKRQERADRRAGADPKEARVYIGPTLPHGHLVERGHWLVKGRGPNARTIGWVGAHPFLRPAFDAQKEEAWRVFREQVVAELTKTARAVRSKAEAGTLSRRATESLLEGAEDAT